MEFKNNKIDRVKCANILKEQERDDNVKEDKPDIAMDIGNDALKASSEQWGVEMTMECEVEFLDKNRRYRILRIENNYYLLDMEKNIWAIFLPLLFWLMPQKAYNVNLNTIESLRAPTSTSTNLSSIISLGIGGSVILSQVLKPILDFSIQTAMIVNVLMLILTASIIFYLRLYSRKKSYQRLHNSVDLESLDTMLIKIKPKFFKQYIVPIFGHLFFVILTIFSISLFITTGNFIGIIFFTLFFSFVLIADTSAVHPDLGKVNLYQITNLG